MGDILQIYFLSIIMSVLLNSISVYLSAFPSSLGECIVICAVCAMLVEFFQLFQVKKLVIKVKHQELPGLFPWPVIGNVLSFGCNPHLAFHNLAAKYGSIYKVKIGAVNAVIINNLATAKSAFCQQKSLFSCRPNFASYKYVSRGQSVVFNDETTLGKDWKRNRSTVVRHLHQFTTALKTRDRMNELITTETLHMLTELDRISRSSEKFFNPEDVVRMTVANSVCAICFGKRFEYNNKEFCQLLSMNTEFGAVLTAGAAIDAMPWLTIIPKFKKAMKDYLFINKKLDDWVMNRVDEVLNYTNENRNLVTSMTSEFISPTSSRLEDFGKETLSALIEDIFAAGQHTTSSTFFWVLTYLQTYEQVKLRIRKEISDVVGDRLPMLKDRDRLPYIEAFIHEVFRHSSLLSSSLPHTTSGDTVLNGFLVPRGTMVIVNQYTINRDPMYWPDPEKFDPSRFLTTNQNGVVELNSLVDKYIVFSIGTRKCPGMEIAKQWLYLATAILVQQSEILNDPIHPPTTDAEYGLVLKPKRLFLKLKNNNNQ